MKRLLILLLALLAYAPKALAVLALDQQVGLQVLDSTNGPDDFTFSSLPSAGSLVALTLVGYHGSGFDVSGVVDNQGNSYTIYKASTVANGQRAVIAYAHNVISSGTFTITVSYTNSSNYVIGDAVSFDGWSVTSALDQSGQDAETSYTIDANVATDGATAVNDEVVVAVTSLAGGTSAIGAASTGYTQIFEEPDFSAHARGAGDFKIVSSTGVQTAAWNDDNDAPWTAVIATFREAAGAVTRRKVIVVE